MKILDAKQIKEVDRKTTEYLGITSLQLMEQAAGYISNWIMEKYSSTSKPILIICGTGNNGGDGFAVARMLYNEGYKITIWALHPQGSKYSQDCKTNYDKCKERQIPIVEIEYPQNNIEIPENMVVIDAIFGTGLSRDLDDISMSIINKLNASKNIVVSVDVPSGLFLDRKTDLALNADYTLTLQIPKLALFLPKNNEFVGDIHIIPIGLSEKAVEESETDIFYTEKNDIEKLVKKISPFTHKGIQGHGLIIGGSRGKIGSVCLSSQAVLRSGAGLVTAFVPQCGLNILQTAFPEAMVIEDENENIITNINIEINPSAIGIGPGMGKHSDTQQAFHKFLRTVNQPLVIDADAINILGIHKEWCELLPEDSVLTPHPKELERLIGNWKDDFEKIEKAKYFCKKYKVILVIKGHNTLIINGEQIFINSTGTSALATAGSGDVLTGIITGLKAQQYSSLHAAILGVYIHGLTADITTNTIHPRSFIASDIIENIGNAYLFVDDFE